jgi:hypothetical protein
MDLRGKKFAWAMLIMASIGFLFNFLWEIAQMSLYQGTSQFWQNALVCLAASFVDDLLILLLYGVLAAVRKDIKWIMRISSGDVLLLILLGSIEAMVIELWALSTGRWQYTQAMPLLPFIHVGLVPVLQMIILPIATFYISKLFFSRYKFT